MEKSATNDTKTSNYQVKNIETVITGSDVRAPVYARARRGDPVALPLSLSKTQIRMY